MLNSAIEIATFCKRNVRSCCEYLPDMLPGAKDLAVITMPEINSSARDRSGIAIYGMKVSLTGQ